MAWMSSENPSAFSRLQRAAVPVPGAMSRKWTSHPWTSAFLLFIAQVGWLGPKSQGTELYRLHPFPQPGPDPNLLKPAYLQLTYILTPSAHTISLPPMSMCLALTTCPACKYYFPCPPFYLSLLMPNSPSCAIPWHHHIHCISINPVLHMKGRVCDHDCEQLWKEAAGAQWHLQESWIR